jgi:ribosomal protein S27AE
MSLTDLTDILEGSFSPSEIVEMLDNISKYDIENYAVKNNTCPRCYSELSTRNWKENRGECHGFPSYENMSELVCQRCHWTID